ncbi:hypothetical protein SAMN05421780_107205 [Flexibacter flexilis DSM 6793]|uniref:Uncharacterized protein n=1 Tax=Flexibacter flexilis DSM 6793 TaxID=927664 RepID=A0A1I1KTU9_9BACT|nr:hypothetical protein [Flexibacter flexilis]SFC64209.1 hypothetical protein SAMN05421780_107205 [Flexibacter flexilis DSM 6793]
METLLPSPLPDRIDQENWEKLHLHLSQSIGALLQQGELERLMQIFYRLDVSEIIVQRIFKTQPSELWPELLATEMLKREQKRLYYRNLYKNADHSELPE